MTALTMFTIPYPWNKGNWFIHRQENCLRSWTLLEPRPEIILCANEEGVAEAANKWGFVHIPEVEYEVGAPVIPSVFELAEERANSDVVMYANADVIFMQDLMDAIEIVAARFDRFMMVGQKRDIEIGEALDFSDGWQERLREHVQTDGELHGGGAVDWYVYRRDRPVGVDLPRFVIGGTGWDTWLVDDTLRRGFAVVDVTDAVFCVHQHKHGSRPGASNNHNRTLFLERLAEQRREYASVRGKTNHATWELLADGTLQEVPEEHRGVAREKRYKVRVDSLPEATRAEIHEPSGQTDAVPLPEPPEQRGRRKKPNRPALVEMNVLEARGN